MKKIICVTLVLVMGLLFCSCGSSQEVVDYGSFTMDKTYSFDESYYAKLNYFDIDKTPTVAIDIYKAQDDMIVPSIITFPEADFQGYCWEKDTYNLWVQIKDKGVVCYTRKYTEWVIDESAELPDYIKTMPKQ